MSDQNRFLFTFYKTTEFSLVERSSTLSRNFLNEQKVIGGAIDRKTLKLEKPSFLKFFTNSFKNANNKPRETLISATN